MFVCRHILFRFVRFLFVINNLAKAKEQREWANRTEYHSLAAVSCTNTIQIFEMESDFGYIYIRMFGCYDIDIRLENGAQISHTSNLIAKHSFSGYFRRRNSEMMKCHLKYAQHVRAATCHRIIGSAVNRCHIIYLHRSSIVSFQSKWDDLTHKISSTK